MDGTPQVRAGDLLEAMQDQRNKAMDEAAEWKAIATDRLRVIEMLQQAVTELRNHTHDEGEKTDPTGDSDG